MSKVTFVTAYINGQSPDYYNRANETIKYFNLLSQCNINLVVFVDNDTIKLMTPYLNNSNIHIILTDLQEFKLTKLLKLLHAMNNNEIQLPFYRSPDKDTKNFLILMNSKTIEFLDRAISENYFSSTHFAWIDFRIFHVIKNVFGAQQYLNMISDNKLKDKFLAMSGCNTLGKCIDYVNSVYWKFCGGFFIGDIQSVRDFCDKSWAEMNQFLTKYKTLTWEINYWTYLEDHGHMTNFEWYSADHNDTIIMLPRKYFI